MDEVPPMSWKVSLFIAPLLIAPALQAAVAPPPRCGPDSRTTDQAPVPLDLSGRPLPRTGLASTVFSAIPTIDSTATCVNPMPSSRQADTLQDQPREVLHGLPAPELPGPSMPRTGYR